MELWGLHPLYILIFMDMIFYLHLLSKYGYSSISSYIFTQKSHDLMPWRFPLVLSSGYSCFPLTPHILISLLSPHCMARTPTASTMFYEAYRLFQVQGLLSCLLTEVSLLPCPLSHSTCLGRSLCYLLTAIPFMTQIQIWNKNNRKFIINELFHLAQHVKFNSKCRWITTRHN